MQFQKVYFIAFLFLFLHGVLTQAKPIAPITIGIGTAVGGPVISWGIRTALDKGWAAVEKSKLIPKVKGGIKATFSDIRHKIRNIKKKIF